jgi:GTP-binding protein HflX
MEKAIAVGVVTGRQTKAEVEEYLAELGRLADTAGAKVLHTVIQERKRIDPATHIGKGKVEEVAKMVEDDKIDIVIFDDDLSPMKIRNLEEVIKCKIIDRSGLILDIFASRAKTKEAMTQVELAQLEYALPRLTRQWTHLSKQFGGIGTKGPGETQIETDRREIRRKISHLKEKLTGIERERVVQRARRIDVSRVALVGYTNAGKSTILKALSKANVLVEDRLFATVDTTVRKVAISPATTILLSDTVGFIRKLPHQLVASFKSTLAEVIEADLLLHVIDISHPGYAAQIEVVRATLEELGATDKPMLYVFNKIDAVEDRNTVALAGEKYTPSVFVAAGRNINMSGLKDAVLAALDEETVVETVTIPQSEYKRVAGLHEFAHILRKEYEGNSVRLEIRVNRKNVHRLARLLGVKG